MAGSKDGAGSVDLLPEEDLLQLLGFTAADWIVAHFFHFEYFLIDDILFNFSETDSFDFGELYTCRT